MAIATKNNALILKDGKVTDGCCCGWYCYCEDDCNTSPACAYCLGSCGPYYAPESFTATISASDYVHRAMGRIYYSLTNGVGVGVGVINYFKGSAIAGTHTMVRVSATKYTAVIPDDPNCANFPGQAPYYLYRGRSHITFDISSCILTLSIRRMWETSLANFPAHTPPKEKQDLDCTVASCGSQFMCNVPGNHWIFRNTEGVGQESTFLSNYCQIASEQGVTLSITLPEQWGIGFGVASFTGFGITTIPGVTGPYGYVADPVLYEKSGSRTVTAVVTPNY